MANNIYVVKEMCRIHDAGYREQEAGYRIESKGRPQGVAPTSPIGR